MSILAINMDRKIVALGRTIVALDMNIVIMKMKKNIVLIVMKVVLLVLLSTPSSQLSINTRPSHTIDLAMVKL